MKNKPTTAELAAQDAAILAAFHEFERADPEAHAIGQTAEKLGVTEDRVMDAIEREICGKDAAKLKLYAGCDVDLFVKLFATDDGKTPRPVTHDEWIKLLDKAGARPGEMLEVTLSRDSSCPSGRK